MLLDPLVQPNDITDNEHRSILVTFLIHDRPKLSLKVRTSFTYSRFVNCIIVLYNKIIFGFSACVV